eukprot:7387905-Prymnesium_polylepis.1
MHVARDPPVRPCGRVWRVRVWRCIFCVRIGKQGALTWHPVQPLAARPNSRAPDRMPCPSRNRRSGYCPGTVSSPARSLLGSWRCVGLDRSRARASLARRPRMSAAPCTASGSWPCAPRFAHSARAAAVGRGRSPARGQNRHPAHHASIFSSDTGTCSGTRARAAPRLMLGTVRCSCPFCTCHLGLEPKHSASRMHHRTQPCGLCGLASIRVCGVAYQLASAASASSRDSIDEQPATSATWNVSGPPSGDTAMGSTAPLWWWCARGTARSSASPWKRRDPFASSTAYCGGTGHLTRVSP